MNITVVEVGYAGLASAILLAQYNEVTELDLITEKVDTINKKYLQL